MKKLYTIVALFTLFIGSAQIVNIPDADFRSCLFSASPSTDVAQNAAGQYIKIDTNNDGQIQVSEALAVYELNTEYFSIESMTGIHAFSNLKIFKCGNNQLMSLDVSQNTNLQSLHCNNNYISNLILPQSNSFIKLICDNNQLTNLDVSQCIALKNLSCAYNQLTSIDVSQNLELVVFYCYNNYYLSAIDISNNLMLYEFDCSVNQLTFLDFTNNSNLHSVNCSDNEITSILLPTTTLSNFFGIDCSNNLIESFDMYNKKVNYVNLIANPTLVSINIKNGLYNDRIDIGGNINNLRYICIDEQDFNNIGYIFGNANLSNILINSYCSFELGGTFYTIEGNSKFDNNSNGCDSNDLNIPNQKFTITNGTISGSLIANQSGTYSIPVQQGIHTITPVLENPSYFTVSPASASVSFPSATSPFTQDFCVTANGIFNDVEIIIIPIEVARPGFDAEYKIIYKNKGNQVANGSLSFTFDDAIMDLVIATPVNDGNATNSLSWNYTNLNPFETGEIDLVFNINSPMEIPAVNGDDVLDYTATIVGATDETPNDNTFTLNQTVVNSYDPNDKTCLEGSTITPSMVGQYVHYVIRFENTGTFAAQNIVVRDIINTAKFDIATLVPQRSSHDFVTRITNTNKVEFIFENINLPFDDANNDGYVAFKIKTKPTLVLGDTFSNEASIYFDYNFPIITEPAVTTVAALSNQDFDFGSYFALYPNPTKDILNFEVKNEIGIKSIQVYNTLGQIVLVVTNASTTRSIDVASLNAGAYFIKVTTDKGSANSKFIKE
ncbi:DUF7619 domain-containing protein [Flavobacterium dankookense]|uniref:Putative repeat protein (TIGR01451 family)/predicted secreted protein (Por secretion system target) n=1 Tax=Flavobacterium dankookense TaxID=706186 RepID=A0A4R6Q6B6_9FLAO|nr:T9SS type A sorting domain-containing protein [Flavobacterium dankookense]TDP57994.1 putative repeat protein (TIGR01451 family)/predicted secreted protein (Por secretion system target) [Flavobacterium dankookense]